MLLIQIGLLGVLGLLIVFVIRQVRSVLRTRTGGDARALPMDEKLHRTLRILVACEITFGLVCAVALLVLERSLPSELRSFVAEQKRTLEWGLVDWLGTSSLITLVVGWIGLWRLWWRARTIYTVGWALGILSSFFTGPHVYLGPPEAAGLLSTIATGLIFGVIYLTDLRHRFVKPRREVSSVAA